MKEYIYTVNETKSEVGRIYVERTKELIRCKDCRYGEIGDDGYSCLCGRAFPVDNNINHYCSYAEPKYSVTMDNEKETETIWVVLYRDGRDKPTTVTTWTNKYNARKHFDHVKKQHKYYVGIFKTPLYTLFISDEEEE